MRLVLTLAAALILTGCEEPAAPAPPVTTPTPAPPVQVSQWAFAIGKNSVELAWLADPKVAASPFRMICAAEGGLMVVASAFKPISSEERLSIGAGSNAFALVAVAGEGEVRATGPIEEGLLTALQSGEPIAASYGAQTFGPVDAPPAAVRRAFADTCRKLNGEKAV